MKIISDLHIHSKYSRATSEDMNIPSITRFARIKGLNLVGTGDFTHPKWLEELRELLIPIPEINLYKPAQTQEAPVYYMITSEVSTIFEFRGQVKKIHHMILVPNLEVAAQVNDSLAKYGDLAVDGRPTLNLPAPELVDEVMSISMDNEIIPSHAWTPWFSLFGAFSGFDSVDDCYQDMTRHIHAIETGLSSDPPLNWRLSSLDRFVLVSNSDSHSAWPWRIGREANIFELEVPSYHGIIDAIRKKDLKRFKCTIEVDPSYGKYHWTGHRNCNVSLPPAEAIKLGGRCPVCHRRLTKGVEQRVEELADRPLGFKPEGVVPYLHLLPLSEVIAAVVGVDQPSNSKVWKVYNALVERFGNEFTVLIDVPQEKLLEVVDPRVAEAVIRVREDRIKVIPGYDGVYGKLIIFPEEGERGVAAGLGGEGETSEKRETVRREEARASRLDEFM